MSAASTTSLDPRSTSFLTWDGSGSVTIKDKAGFVRDGIDRLVRDATFGSDATKQHARHLIWEAAHELGITSASIHDLYMASGRGEVKGFTVPAMNIRGPTYDVVRAALRAAKKHDVGALIFELARSEMEYTHQTPAEYATSVLAAAIKEEWSAPIFIQGDHFQFNAKKYKENPEKVSADLQQLVRDAVVAGFYNIDIDASTLVDLSKPTVKQQQLVNSELTAQMTRLIRSIQPDGVTISVGGEIGEVGKKNSTVEELTAYVDQLRNMLQADQPAGAGISKVSVQTGTTHGGVVGKDGKVVKVEVDFSTLKELGEAARSRYGMSGCVQHGASTLPDELFHKFPEVETAEIHLATGFQNAYLDHPAFPKDLKARIYKHLETAHADERTPDQTIEQFHYKTRKKCFGPFKQELWEMEESSKKALMSHLEERFAFMYQQLRVTNTRALVAKHVKPKRVRRRPPAGLAASG